MSQFLHEGFGGSAADYDPTHFVIVTWKDVTHHISESTVSIHPKNVSEEIASILIVLRLI